jgi:hypothetical protein
MRYHATADGAVYSGTPEEIVRAMIADERLMAKKTIGTFMRNTANRCAIYTGAVISTATALDFLRSLADEQYLLLEPAEEPTPIRGANREDYEAD